MRKTRLLLNAVERVGCRDVTFVALDLCEDSLRDALTALQGAHTLLAPVASCQLPDWQLPGSPSDLSSNSVA